MNQNNLSISPRSHNRYGKDRSKDSDITFKKVSTYIYFRRQMKKLSAIKLKYLMILLMMFPKWKALVVHC